MDLLEGLIGLALALLGKYWYIVLGVILFKLFGRGKQQQQKHTPPPLTPVERPEAPAYEEEGRSYGEYEWEPEPTSPKRELTEVEAELLARESQNQQDEAVPVFTLAEERSEPPAERVEAVAKPEQPQLELPPNPAREGMKWAMIFAQPRAKAPYTPPYATRGQNKRNAQ